MSSIPFAAFTTKSVHDVIRRQKQQEDGKYRGTGSSIGQSEGTAKKPNRKYSVVIYAIAEALLQMDRSIPFRDWTQFDYFLFFGQNVDAFGLS